MEVISSAIEPSDPQFQANVQFHRHLAEELRSRPAQIRQGGEPKYHERHAAQGKLFVRERIDRLLDSGSPFLELSPLAAWEVYPEPAPAAGIFTLGLAVGLTISDLTEGTTVANLGYEKVTHPNPVFHGDTLYVETEVLDKRPSNSRPDCGVIRLKHSGFKSDSIIVIKFERIVLFLKRPSSAN